MKKILFFLLISLHAFSQVFEVDSSFKFEVVKKPIPGYYPRVTQLPNGLLHLKYDGNIFNGNLSDTKSYILDKEGNVITKSPLDFELSMYGGFVTNDSKFIFRQYSKYPVYKLYKYLLNGELDPNFDFPLSVSGAYNTFLLPDNKFMLEYINNRLCQYAIYDENGKFLKELDLAQFGISKGKLRIENLVYNRLNELFLLLRDEDGTSIIKTTSDFKIDKVFSKILYVPENQLNYSIKIEISNNNLLLFRANSDRKKNLFQKYDQKGTKIQETEFDFITEYDSYSNPQIYIQNDKSIDLIFYNNSHVKILPDGRLDSLYYKNEKQKNISFLHAFADGTYWVIQNKSELIQKMYANGIMDLSFRISLQKEIVLYPYEIKKLANNNYLVDFTWSPSFHDPYQPRYSSPFNCIRLYNSKHQFVQEIYDSKTKWEIDSDKNSFFLRGDGKFIKIDSSLKMSTSVDSIDLINKETETTKVKTIVEQKYNYVYKIEQSKSTNESLIRRQRNSTGKYDSFTIIAYNFENISTINDGRIAVVATIGSKLDSLSIDIYMANGQRDESVKRILLPKRIEYVSNTISIEYKNGFIVTITLLSYSGYLRTIFLRYNVDGSFDEKYQSNFFTGAQYRQFQPDGSIYVSSGGLEQTGYNAFYKILPNGKLDSSVAVKGVFALFDFTFFDKNTIYSVCQNTLRRFIKNPSLGDNFFILKELPTAITWEYNGVLKINYKTNLKNLKIVVTGDGVLKDSVIILTQKRAGNIKLEIFDEKNNVLATRIIALVKSRPDFIYDLPSITNTSKPFIFTAKSTSNLPVKVLVNYYPFGNKSIIFPEFKRYYEINLVSEGNEQYERIESTFLVQVFEEPLANEPEESLIYYPNPVKEKLFVQANKLTIDNFKLFTTDGQEIPITMVKSLDRYEISLRNTPPGLYILQANTQTKRFTYRIVVD